MLNRKRKKYEQTKAGSNWSKWPARSRHGINFALCKGEKGNHTSKRGKNKPDIVRTKEKQTVKMSLPVCQATRSPSFALVLQAAAYSYGARMCMKHEQIHTFSSQAKLHSRVIREQRKDLPPETQIFSIILESFFRRYCVVCCCRWDRNWTVFSLILRKKPPLQTCGPRIFYNIGKITALEAVVASRKTIGVTKKKRTRWFN